MAFKVEKLANFKTHLENVQYRNPEFKYHDISTKDLYLSPFKKENVFTPITGVMVLIAGATLTANYFVGEKNNSPSLLDIEKMAFADRYIPRNQAVITSYSIHYTKLYELCSFSQESSKLLA